MAEASQKSYFLMLKWLYKKHSQEIVDFHLESVKTGGSLARNAFFDASTSQAGRSRVRFAWQVQHFGSVSILACRFLVAGAAVCDVARWLL